MQYIFIIILFLLPSITFATTYVGRSRQPTDLYTIIEIPYDFGGKRQLKRIDTQKKIEMNYNYLLIQRNYKNFDYFAIGGEGGGDCIGQIWRYGKYGWQEVFDIENRSQISVCYNDFNFKKGNIIYIKAK